MSTNRVEWLIFSSASSSSLAKVLSSNEAARLVVNDISDGGVVVIPRGSQVVASVTWKTGKAVGGKSGKFEVTFEKVNVRGRDYAMRGVHRQEGKGNTVAAVFATWLVSGRSAVMQPGQFVNAFTAEAIPY